MSSIYVHEHNWYIDDFDDVVRCSCGVDDEYTDLLHLEWCFLCGERFESDNTSGICLKCSDVYGVQEVRLDG